MPETPDWSAPREAVVVPVTNQVLACPVVGGQATYVAAVAGRSIVLDWLSARPYNSGNATDQLRNWAVIMAVDNVSGDILTSLGISAESPFAAASIRSGQVATGVGSALDFAGRSQYGSGSQNVIIDLGYHLE